MNKEEMAAMIDRAGLSPCASLPKYNPNQRLEEFLRVAALRIAGAAHLGHSECEFRINGIPNTPRWVMEAAIEPFTAMGYKTEFKTEITPGKHEEVFLVVSGWGD